MKNISLKNLGENFSAIISGLRAKKSCSLFGVQYALKPIICADACDNILYITSDEISANKAKEYFENLGAQVSVFPNNPDSFIYKKAQSTAGSIARAKAIYNILTQKAGVTICTADSLLAPLCNPTDFENAIINLFCGQTFEPAILSQKLVDAGYIRTEFVSEPGQFCARGEVVDIFAINAENVTRIDYFDDQIETISVLDDTAKPVKNINEFSICPCTNLFLNSVQKQQIIAKLYNLANISKIEDQNEKTIFEGQIEDIISRLEKGNLGFGLDFLSSFLGAPFCLIDYMEHTGRDFIFAIDETKMVYDTLVGSDKENQQRLKDLEKGGTLIADRKFALNSSQIIIEKLNNFAGIAFQKITNANRFFEPEIVVDLSSKPATKYIRDTAGLAKDMEIWRENGFKVICFAGSNADVLEKNLSNYDINIAIDATIKDFNKTTISRQTYPTGFLLPHERVAVLGTYDLFAKPNPAGKLAVGRENVFSIPKVGDYVVHAIHGIGMCEGVTKLSGTFGTKDYVVVRYAGGDKLYVPTTQMNLLDRFSGGEAPKKLSKIGGQEFEKVKQKVKESVKKLAFNLVNLYAKRENIKGFAFSPDVIAQKEFEDAFAYTETQDQLTSIAEIKRDMQSTKVMDRLLCGDVGFGKTEVAMRAAFKAVLDNKQVAFLAPTTILSQQHYNTCLSRMREFGVNVEVLNRFKSPKETKDILRRLKEHKIDILCSTHRMLSDDVEFADLGLIILDEEQKFGVNDKEKLKNKHPRVDVLTLSATPIPRTLHMSLSGIRDISVISTPPSQRLPVNTYVTEFSDGLVRDAITREKSRGGQTFILYNKVESIYDFATKIRHLVPECTVLVGHGQMPANLLEQTVYDFYTGKADVLICTTIMENGIDIENANTLIVCNADRFGLSQLYQIRGRVGRGNKMAYAYFTYEYNKVLTEEAYKRLDAISEFTEFGSGFKLAMRDLEIRGSGNVLGAEQHGFLQKVGYDMYSKLLARAVAEARGEVVEEQTETQMKVNIDAYIPNDYILSSEERMIAYKKISAISRAEDCTDVLAELESKLGKAPQPVKNLIDIAYTKSLASKLKVTELLTTDAQAYLLFDDRKDIMDSEALGAAIYKFASSCALELTDKPKIKFTSAGDKAKNYARVKEFLQFAVNTTKSQ